MKRFDTTASRFLIAASALFFFAQTMTSQTPAPTPAPDKTALARAEALRVVDAWLDSLQAYRHIPAVSAGVVVGDNLVWSKGYGTLDADHKIPADSDTIYSICSISKLFTSISLMQQYEAGKVRLDDPITTYLPWAKLKDDGQDSVPITLRGMLSHSAGLPREFDFPYWSGPDFAFPTREQIRTSIANQNPLSPAERYFGYSNLGLTLVGETVEAVSSETYAQYAKTHVLDPIGLHDTRTSMPMELYGTRLAVAYGALKRDGTRDLLKPFNTQGITPAAGYTSTVRDLAKFASWQFRLLRTGKPEVLKASTLREMQRVQFMDPGWKTTWGLGFSIQRSDNHTYVGHAGDCPGYHTVLMLRTEDELGVVLMDNAADRAAALAPVVFAILDKRQGYEFKAPPPAPGMDLEAYAGHYSGQPWVAESVMLPWAGGLVSLSLPNNDPVANLEFFKPKGADIFRKVREDGSEAEELKFTRDVSGKVTGYIQSSNPKPRMPLIEQQ